LDETKKVLTSNSVDDSTKELSIIIENKLLIPVL
jgi:hypothetical protein